MTHHINIEMVMDFNIIIAETVEYWELNRFGAPVTGATARVMSHYHHQWYSGMGGGRDGG